MGGGVGEEVAMCLAGVVPEVMHRVDDIKPGGWGEDGIGC